jgi:hypothetical protein
MMRMRLLDRINYTNHKINMKISPSEAKAQIASTADILHNVKCI